MKRFYNIGIVGATGLVGQNLIKLLKDFPVKNLYLFASKNSKNKKIIFKNKTLKVKVLEENSFKTPMDIIFFCAGSKISKKFIPLIKNSTSIDLSSAFREEKKIPLIIPEINSHLLKKNQKIISSPNCTTTIMLLPLYPLHKRFQIKRIVASTYQAASGGGRKLLNKLKRDTLISLNENNSNESNFNEKIFNGNNSKENNFYGFNLFLHNSPLNSENYSEEEVKIKNETKKILKNKEIEITATSIRVPVIRAHSISLNVEFKKNITFKKIVSLLKKTKGIKISNFATPLDATGKNEILCSRIRQDPSKKNTIDLFIVGDQLLKGASLNAYQIAEKLINL
jgi:aspartate-semialdehyde dehydrogenase